MYADITLFAAMYAREQADGHVPDDLSFDDFVEIKHHAGQYTRNLESAPASRDVLGYASAKIRLGFSIVSNANRGI
jgi:hypothetical protein